VIPSQYYLFRDITVTRCKRLARKAPHGLLGVYPANDHGNSVGCAKMGEWRGVYIMELCNFLGCWPLATSLLQGPGEIHDDRPFSLEVERQGGTGLASGTHRPDLFPRSGRLFFLAPVRARFFLLLGVRRSRQVPFFAGWIFPRFLLSFLGAGRRISDRLLG